MTPAPCTPTTKSTHRPGRTRLAALITLGLVAAGCGAKEGDADTAATTAEPTTAEPTTSIAPAAAEPTTAIAPSGAGAIVDPLVGIGQVELIVAGYGWTEGPQWLPDEGVLLFTDDRGIIFQLAADDQISVFRQPSDGANGLALDPEGRLIVAEKSKRRVTRTESDGTVTPIAEQFEGVRLNQPNDIAVRSDGTIYFTDPYYGDGTTDLDFRGVFRITPAGELTAERRGDITEQPNGIALSPDETHLYVANWADDLIWMFDVAADGSLSQARTFVTTADGPDGMAVDDAGNLFVATGEGIEVFAPDGTALGVIPVPASNCAFGGPDGRTLYITQPQRLYRVTLTNPGPY
jgi:gluconolactonase